LRDAFAGTGSFTHRSAAHWVHRDKVPLPFRSCDRDASMDLPSGLDGSSSSVPSALLLQSSFAPIPRSDHVDPSLACLGSFPSSRHHARASTFHEELPGPRYGPASSFLNSLPAFSAHALAGLFHPAATSRVLPVQGLLSPHSHPSSSEGAFPLAVGTSALTTLRSLPRPKLLDYEAFICAKRRSVENVMHLFDGRSPLQVSLLQVLLLAFSSSLPRTLRS